MAEQSRGAGTRQTEVRLDRWFKGDLGQQMNDGEGCATMRERQGRVETPGVHLTDWSHFCLEVIFTWSYVNKQRQFFRTALKCSGGYQLEKGGMPLHDAVGLNSKNGPPTENQGAGVKQMG